MAAQTPIRVVINRNAFWALVSGGVIQTHAISPSMSMRLDEPPIAVEITLSDIGFSEMRRAIRDAEEAIDAPNSG